ncbi:hypothetical protein C3L33_22408, partial [Rhododendron williamsianum]
LAHPGGPLTTNKAAALAKFLERKLQDPNGLDSLKPELLELAVKNAKATVNAIGSVASGFSGYSGCLCGNSEGSITDKILDEEVSVLFSVLLILTKYRISKTGGTSRSGRVIRHVDSFGDSEMEALEDEGEKIETKKQKKKKKKKNAMGKNKKHKPLKDPGDTVLKKPKTKLKL